MKKQIVFVETKPSTYALRIARTLKNTGRYETFLISFEKLDYEIFKDSFDKIFIFELSHKANFNNLILFLKRISSREFRAFLRKIRKLEPFIFQFTGPDIFTTALMFLTKKKPKIYFAYDVWGGAASKLFAKGYPTIKSFFQEFFEKIGFRKANGVLNMSSPEEFKKLSYKIKAPKLTFVPGCLDEWILPPKQKKSKEIHMVYASGPFPKHEGRVPFMEGVKALSSQKIHLHTYGSCVDKKDNKIFEKEAENNKYFHFHKRVDMDKLDKEISKYDYGVFPDFYFGNIIKPISLRNEMANKLFNYIEAGLPIIMTKDLGLMAQIVEENKIGIAVNFEEFKNIRNILANKSYSQMQKNMKKAQEKFKLSRNIWKLEGFYEKIVNSWKKQN